MRKNMARRPAEDHLADPALGIGALDQEVAADRFGMIEDRLSGMALAGGNGHGLDFETMTAQGPGELFPGRTGNHSAFRGQDDDSLRLTKEAPVEIAASRLLVNV